jgi:hypothetical protein
VACGFGTHNLRDRCETAHGLRAGAQIAVLGGLCAERKAPVAEYDNSIEFLDGLNTDELVVELHRRHDALVVILDEVERTRSAVEAASEAMLERFAPQERDRSTNGPASGDPLKESVARLRARVERLRLVRDDDDAS